MVSSLRFVSAMAGRFLKGLGPRRFRVFASWLSVSVGGTLRVVVSGHESSRTTQGYRIKVTLR